MSANDAVDELYSVEDLARLFGVTKETVFRWNSGGTGPRRILIGRRVYYRSADVQEWINARESK
jgi:predicted DNA-binding transcriptional regulator AlpA